MGGLALFVFLVLPIVEILVAYWVAAAIGGFATALLLLGTSIVGGVVVRRAGARAWAELRAAAATGRPPRDVLDGAIVLVGGLLLLVPGFVTDALGILLLLPLTRRFTRWLVAAYAARRVQAARARLRRHPRGPADDDVIDGEVVEDTTSPPGRERPGQIGRAG